MRHCRSGKFSAVLRRSSDRLTRGRRIPGIRIAWISRNFGFGAYVGYTSTGIFCGAFAFAFGFGFGSLALAAPIALGSPRSIPSDSTALRPGYYGAMSGDSVRRVQQALERSGYSVGGVDGQVGPRTRSALRRYQEQRRLRATGRIDQPTLSALGVASYVARDLSRGADDRATAPRGLGDATAVATPRWPSAGPLVPRIPGADRSLLTGPASSDPTGALQGAPPRSQ